MSSDLNSDLSDFKMAVLKKDDRLRKAFVRLRWQTSAIKSADHYR
jgi:hypothetical protein